MNAPANFCDCGDSQHPVRRRDFLKTAGGLAIGAGAIGSLKPGRVWAKPRVVEASQASPESLVKTLYETLSPAQRETVCFDWEHQDSEQGLLRSRVAANWQITDPSITDPFYSDDQRAIIRGIYEGIFQPDWHAKIDQQLEDDAGGYGESNSIAIFGTPGSDEFEFVMTGRHMTFRCDGNSADHVAFGGPIFYGHAANGFDEGPDHEGNVFWPQAQAANGLYQMFDGRQRDLALIKKGLPNESHVAFRGQEGPFQGIPITELSSDQKVHLQQVLQKLLEPYRQTDRDEAMACLTAQGGLDACQLAFYAKNDIGNDGVWDNWRLEGPAFVWHFRGAPHVHVWVHVADNPSVKLNA